MLLASAAVWGCMQMSCHPELNQYIQDTLHCVKPLLEKVRGHQAQSVPFEWGDAETLWAPMALVPRNLFPALRRPPPTKRQAPGHVGHIWGALW